MLKPFSVPRIWIPTVFSSLGAPVRPVTNLAGCENCLTSPRVLAALRDIDPRLLIEHWYSQDDTLRQTLAKIHSVSPGEVFLTSGAIAGIRYAFEVLVRQDAHVGLLVPDFPGFRYFAKHQQARISYLERPAFPFQHSIRDIISFMREKDIGLLILSNPSAATGTGKTEAEITELLRALPNIYVIIDEADSVETQSVASLTNSYNNLLVLRSFSKFYGLSGLRIGYMVVPQDLVGHFARTVNPAELTSLALVAATAALEDFDFQSETQTRVEEGRRILESGLKGTAYQVVPGSCCFAAYVWADEKVEDPYTLLGRHNIDIVRGSDFGLVRGGRMNLSDPAKVKQAVKILRKH